MKIIMILLSALASYAAVAENLTPREQAAQDIYLKMKAGVLPSATESTQFYTGSCITLSSALDPRGSYYAILALKKVGDVFKTNMSISYASNPVPSSNRYADLTYAQLLDRYEVKRTAAVQENNLFIDVNQSPRLFYYVSADAQNADKIYFVASHIGLVYCELNKIQ